MKYKKPGEEKARKKLAERKTPSIANAFAPQAEFFLIKIFVAFHLKSFFSILVN